MHSEHPSDSAPSSTGTGLWAWLNHRTGLDDVLRTALYEPIPGGARFAYIFGSGLLFIFLSQIITGVFLALYYVPSADHAHTTVAYITKAVTAGAFLRSLHAYGASAMVIVLFMHLSQTYIYGAYKGRREILWLSGCALFGMVLAMAFTGYLLPWDQRAYFATAVGTSAASEIPWIGETIKRTRERLEKVKRQRSTQRRQRARRGKVNRRLIHHDLHHAKHGDKQSPERASLFCTAQGARRCRGIGDCAVTGTAHHSQQPRQSRHDRVPGHLGALRCVAHADRADARLGEQCLLDDTGTGRAPESGKP